jgi:hypothetical protein
VPERRVRRRPVEDGPDEIPTTESIMTLFLIWLFAAVLVGVMASGRRNRNGVGWFFLAVLISPLLAGLLVMAMRTLEPGVRRIRMESFDGSPHHAWLLGHPDRRPWSPFEWNRRPDVTPPARRNRASEARTLGIVAVSDALRPQIEGRNGA